jgi:hypothetical protein
MGGYAWVSYDVSGVCPPDETYGLYFTPDRVLPQAPLQPAPGRPGCFIYKAQPGDYPAKLALQFRLSIQGLRQLLLDNLRQLPELNRFMPGAAVLLCGIPNPLPVVKDP